jgi:hypothetical protein
MQKALKEFRVSLEISFVGLLVEREQSVGRRRRGRRSSGVRIRVRVCGIGRVLYTRQHGQRGNNDERQLENQFHISSPVDVAFPVLELDPLVAAYRRRQTCLFFGLDSNFLNDETIAQFSDRDKSEKEVISGDKEKARGLVLPSSRAFIQLSYLFYF